MATLGFSVHTGWAALVAVAGPIDQAAIVDRRRVEMIAGADRDPPRFLFHAARELPLADGERLIRAGSEKARAAARQALEAAVSKLRQEGHAVEGAAILTGAARPKPAPLQRILESHAAIHAAEGELFRDAIRDACAALGIAVRDLPARELQARAAGVLRIPPARVAQKLAAVGRAAGSPWAKDQKDAWLAALTLLA